jgi:putative solute:sodium symporter small subunit
MIERNERKPYWRHTKVQMLTSLLPFVVAIVVLPLYADALNDKRVLGVPLGYFLVCHGLIVIAFVTIAAFVNRQDAIDHWHGAHEDFLNSDGFHLAHQLVNPRLGTYFGIFTAALPHSCCGADVRAAGCHRHVVRLTMFASPIAHAVIGRLPRASLRTISRAAAGYHLLQRAGARRDGSGRRRLPGADRQAPHRRVRRHVPQHGWCAGPFSWGCCLRRSCASSEPTVPTFLGRRYERPCARWRRRRSPCRSSSCLQRNALRATPLPPGSWGNRSGWWLPWSWPRRGHIVLFGGMLAHLVERRRGDPSAPGAGAVGQHRRPHGFNLPCRR